MGERKRVSVACNNCRKSHLKCDAGRPCSRCIGKGIAHLCKTAETQRRGRKGISKASNSNKNKQLKNVSKKVAKYGSGGTKLGTAGEDHPKRSRRTSSSRKRRLKVKVEDTILTIEEASSILVAISESNW
eukprot:TRINITY_DN11564_c0_g1_i1.p1 TRINITY_DN11564_c0_g1~~TRINITY_DN11564_c0_g1_i1.p1  ORF type:complete len:130 (-),score=23.53 TRINITY_DN11564_c0_g1_i1:99-488(-)